MARVRYLGWSDQTDSRKGSRIVTINQKSRRTTVTTLSGRQFVFRGMSGKPSQWRVVDDLATVEYFENEPAFEVQR